MLAGRSIAFAPPLVVVVLGLAGCGGSNSPAEPVDSSVADTPDASPEAGADPDVGADVAPPSDARSCDGPLNACGACGPLAYLGMPAKPGDTCGFCRVLGCTTDITGTKLKCEDPERNACGGCAFLIGKRDDPCGTCGKLTCSSTGDKLDCDDPGKNACGGCAPLAGTPGEPCGTCGGKLKCKGIDALECEGATTTNPCLGCTTIEKSVGSSCGKCGSGQYVCATPESTKCKDPVATSAPGVACGRCKTSKFVCAPDGRSTFCATEDDTNECGGCGKLTGTPGIACGTCGVNKCNADSTAVLCEEASPKPGSPCGLCGTGTTVCGSPGKSSCPTPDDRKVGTELTYTTASSTWASTLNPKSLAVAFKSRHSGQFRTVTLVMKRSAAGGAAVGGVTMTAFSGTPDGSAPTALGSVTIAADAVPDKAGDVAFAFGAGVTTVPAGTPVYVQLTTDSTAYSFALSGSTTKDWPSDLAAWQKTDAAWTADPDFAPSIVVSFNGCGF